MSLFTVAGRSVVLSSRLCSVQKSIPVCYKYDLHDISLSQPTSVLCLQTRTFKSNLKIKWVRPPKIPSIHPAKSGDLKPAAAVDLRRLPPEFEKSEAAEKLDDLTKKILSLEFRYKNVAAKIAREEMMDSVKLHNLDRTSDTAEIAQLTARIRSLQEHAEKFPLDRVNKVRLKEMIERRKKLLKFLRVKDYKCFEWLLEKLDLVYRPPPREFIRVTRKDSLRKLTDEHCLKLRTQKLAELRHEYEEIQPIFLREKIEKLQWIRQQEIECGVEVTVSEEDIAKVERQLNELEAASAEKQTEKS